MPRTYQEFMMYVEARRRAEQMRESMKEEGIRMSPETAEGSVTE